MVNSQIPLYFLWKKVRCSIIHSNNKTTTMKTIKLIALSLFCSLVLLIGCNSNDKYGYSSEENSSEYVATDAGGLAPADSRYAVDEAPAAPMANYTPKDEAPIKTPDKIIKTGNMSMVVDTYALAMQRITDKVKAAQGYISNQNEQRSNYRISNTLSIRVPSQNFDVVVNGIGDVAKKLNYKNVNMHDVSEEYTDVAARLKTKKEVEQRYLDILKTAKTIKDILEVESHLRTIREEIESATARLKFMDDRVSYSTVTVELYQDLEYNAPAPLQTGFGHKLLASLTTGWNGLLALIIGLVRIWPLMLVVGVVGILLYRKWKQASAKA